MINLGGLVINNWRRSKWSEAEMMNSSCSIWVNSFYRLGKNWPLKIVLINSPDDVTAKIANEMVTQLAGVIIWNV